MMRTAEYRMQLCFIYGTWDVLRFHQQIISHCHFLSRRGAVIVKPVDAPIGSIVHNGIWEYGYDQCH